MVRQGGVNEAAGAQTVDDDAKQGEGGCRGGEACKAKEGN